MRDDPKNAARDSAGLIVTLRDEDEPGRIAVLHRSGFRTAALRAVCAWADETPGRWVVQSISSIESIRRDLQGARLALTVNGDRNTEVAEVGLLMRVGRGDLIAPEHIRHTSFDPRVLLAKVRR